MRTAPGQHVKEFYTDEAQRTKPTVKTRDRSHGNIHQRIHFCDQHQGAFGAEEVQQTGHSGVSQTGEQVSLLEGPGPRAAPQGQELGSKHFSGPSVDYTLHDAKSSPGRRKKRRRNKKKVEKRC